MGVPVASSEDDVCGSITVSVVQLASVAPGPFLKPAFAVLQAIWTSIEQLTSNRRQMRAIAQAAAQILLALNAQDSADVDTAAREEFERTLTRIEALCARMRRRRFVRAFLESTADQNDITLVHAQLTLNVDALQIEAQVSMLEYSRKVEDARQEDQAESNVALHQLLEKQDALLELIGDAPVAGANDSTQDPDSQTIFRLLEGILSSLKTADVGPGHEEEFQEALARLRKVTAPGRENINPFLVLLQPGLKSDVLIPSLKWRMHRLLLTDNLCIHLTGEQIKQFSAAEVGAQAFIDHLMSCEDRPLQYAALDVFQQDKSLKHFFKQDFSFKPSDDPNLNVILANMKPGMTPAALVPPLRYEGPKLVWKEILRQQLYSDQISMFFQTGPGGVENFIKHVTGSDADLALQYAALEVFKEDKRVAHYFIRDEIFQAEE